MSACWGRKFVHMQSFLSELITHDSLFFQHLRTSLYPWTHILMLNPYRSLLPTQEVLGGPKQLRNLLRFPLLSPLGMPKQPSSPSVPTVYYTVSTVHLLRLTLSFLALTTRHIMSPMQIYKNHEILSPIVGQLSAWNTEGALSP